MSGRRTSVQRGFLSSSSPPPPPALTPSSFSFRRHRGPKLEEFLSRYSNPKYIQLGSALKFTKICENEAQVYPRMAPTCEWDTAAPHVVLSEAGGEILQCGRCTGEGELLEPWEEALGRNQPVCYNKESDLNPFFIAYGRRKN